MNKAINLAKNTILLFAAVQATSGLVSLAKETASLVTQKIKK